MAYNRFVNTVKCFQTCYGFQQIYHSHYNEKLREDKLASFMLAYKSFTVFVYQYLRTCQTKFFDINSEHIKRINVLTYYKIHVSYLNIFTDFNLLSHILKNRFFVQVNQLSSTHFLP